MTDFELVTDTQLAINYISKMQIAKNQDELKKNYRLAKQKIEEVFRDKKALLKK